MELIGQHVTLVWVAFVLTCLTGNLNQRIAAALNVKADTPEP